jgi:undecaprenyl diphosphate synthase
MPNTKSDSSVESSKNPKHIAIIMDGNGRWAEKRFLPRAAGHQAGVKTVRKIVEYCSEQKIQVLTLFAFSSENWRRPEKEVSLLMTLFNVTLKKEIKKLDENNVCLRFIGDRSAFSLELQQIMTEGELKTQNNSGLTLVIAVNYGGHWDICQAVKKIAHQLGTGEITEQDISETLINRNLSTIDLPEPDLFIRTGGEQRVSNFLLWQLAYSEMYFTPVLWPDFDKASLGDAISSFKSRQRRFGHTGKQIIDKSSGFK